MAGAIPRPWDLGLWNVLKLGFGVNLFGRKVEITKPVVLFGHEINKEAVDGLLALLDKKEDGEDLFAQAPTKKGR